MSRKTMMAEGNCTSADQSTISFSSVETTHFCGSPFNAWLRKWTLFLACSSLEMFGGSSLVVNSASYQSLPVHLNFYSDFTLSSILLLPSWSTNPFYCAALIAPSTIVFSGNGCKWCHQTILNPLFLSQHDTVVSPTCPPVMFQVGLPGWVDAVEERGAGLVPKNAA